MDAPDARHGRPRRLAEGPAGTVNLSRGLRGTREKAGAASSSAGARLRCIVSVGMLTEGWDCNTVTHIVGLRPFMSQLLCEQVVGRGLADRSYEVGDDGKLTEEVAKVFGVPFEIIPFRKTRAARDPSVKRHHIHALPEKAAFEIKYPRVEGYRQAIRNHVTIDWSAATDSDYRPDGTHCLKSKSKGPLPSNQGKTFAFRTRESSRRSILNPFRSGRRFQELVFDMAARADARIREPPRMPGSGACVVSATAADGRTDILRENVVRPLPPAETIDVSSLPLLRMGDRALEDAIKPDSRRAKRPSCRFTKTRRGPGSTAEVDFWTSREVREVVRSHLNYVVADTKTWEESAAYLIDTNDAVDAFVKNAGLGFAIPYFYNGEAHDYVPDFIVRLKTEPPMHLILEVKGYDELAEIKAQAAQQVGRGGQRGRDLRTMGLCARKETLRRETIDH